MSIDNLTSNPIVSTSLTMDPGARSSSVQVAIGLTAEHKLNARSAYIQAMILEDLTGPEQQEMQVTYQRIMAERAKLRARVEAMRRDAGALSIGRGA